MDVWKSKALQAHHLWCSRDVNFGFFFVFVPTCTTHFHTLCETIQTSNTGSHGLANPIFASEKTTEALKKIKGNRWTVSILGFRRVSTVWGGGLSAPKYPGGASEATATVTTSLKSSMWRFQLYYETFNRFFFLLWNDQYFPDREA